VAHPIIWSKPALADLDVITATIARHSPITAGRVRRKIVEKTRTIESLPFLGAVYPRDPKGTTREIQSGKYRIFYRFDEQAGQVQILAIWHGARQDPDIL